MNELYCNYLKWVCLTMFVAVRSVIALESPALLDSWSDLDVAVEEVFDGLTNEASLFPPGDSSYDSSVGYYRFSSDGEISAATNLFQYSPRLGVPVWTVRIIETQAVERVWLYSGSDGDVFRTNSVSALFDQDAWVNDLYGTTPGWLDSAGESLWYKQRDRSRIVVTLALVASNDWPLIEDAWDQAITNYPPADTNCVAFMEIDRADHNLVSLQLYAPTNPMPIEIYSSDTLPTGGLWSVAGVLHVAAPFDYWQTSVEAGSAFFNATRADVDSDGDGIPDGREMLVFGTDSGLADSDDDGLTDKAELYQFETDPHNADSDADSIPDGWEVSGEMNPFDASDAALDPDNDKLYNLHEYWIDSDPQIAETNSYAIADAMQAVDNNITGLVPAASLNIFTTQDHSATNYLRNTNCWTATYDLTCCSPWNSYSDASGTGKNRAGTLISPRHVLLAAHYDQITTNDTLRFVDLNNNVVERRLIATKRHPDFPLDYPDSPAYPDFTVGLLESDLPTNLISFAKVLPDDYHDYIGSGRFLPALCLDQQEKALIADLVDIAETNLIEGVDQILTVFDYPADTNRLNYSEEIINGDSGNPAFLILNQQLVLLSVWTYGDAGAGTSVTAFKDDLNQLMTDLGGGYQLTEIDLSKFSSLVR